MPETDVSLPPNRAARRASASNYQPITVSVRDACRIIGVGNTKFYELIAAGEIKTTKVGRRTLVFYQSLLDLVGAPDGQTAKAA